MNNTKPPKKHSESYIETDRKVREMSEDVSLEDVLNTVSEGGCFQFVKDKKLISSNKETKFYYFKYLRIEKVVKITGDMWYSVSDNTKGVGLGSFIYHNFKREGDNHQNAIDRFHVWWQNVVFNLDGKRKRKEPLTLYNPELLGWTVRGDLFTLEFPFFALKLDKKNLTTRTYFDDNQGIHLIVVPSIYGHMTLFDKEILIYSFSMADKNKTRSYENDDLEM